MQLIVLKSNSKYFSSKQFALGFAKRDSSSRVSGGCTWLLQHGDASSGCLQRPPRLPLTVARRAQPFGIRKLILAFVFAK
eukprot:10303-Heterococcus_DN1.PRE.1